MPRFNFFFVRNFVVGFLAVCTGFALLGAFHVTTPSFTLNDRERFVLVRDAAQRVGITSVEAVTIDITNPIPILNIRYRRGGVADNMEREITFICAIRDTDTFEGYIYKLHTIIDSYFAITSIFAADVARLDCQNPASIANLDLIRVQIICGVDGLCGGGGVGNQ